MIFVKVKRFFVYSTLVLLSACNLDNEIYESRMEEVLGIEINEEYTVLEKSSSSAMGDYTETFLIQFDQAEFDRIIGRLKLDQFEKSLDQKFVYLNKENVKGDKKSIVINLKSRTIKYTLADI